MFSLYHLIWFLLSVASITVAVILLRKFRPSLNKVLVGCFVIACMSVAFIICSEISLVPSKDGETLRLYLEAGSFPFHLCAMQIFIIGIAMLAKRQPLKDNILAFIYATGIGGASMSLIICTVFDSIPPEKSFAYPRAYEYHIYHCMLIVLGLYIFMSGEVRFKPKHFFTTFAGLACAAVASIYVNSALASPTYENGVLMSVDYNTNFFFTMEPPIDIPFTETWHWMVYLLVLLGLVIILELALFIPAILLQNKRDRLTDK